MKPKLGTQHLRSALKLTIIYTLDFILFLRRKKDSEMWCLLKNLA